MYLVRRSGVKLTPKKLHTVCILVNADLVSPVNGHVNTIPGLSTVGTQHQETFDILENPGGCYSTETANAGDTVLKSVRGTQLPRQANKLAEKHAIGFHLVSMSWFAWTFQAFTAPSVGFCKAHSAPQHACYMYSVSDDRYLKVKSVLRPTINKSRMRWPE